MDHQFPVSEFRKVFPEFTDSGKYPDEQVSFWGNFACAMVNERAWGHQAFMGRFLYVAHEITLQAQSAAAAAIGGTPGQQPGQSNQKTVGSVSVGYDTVSAAEKDAGWWNLTTYGKQFFRLGQIFGARGVIV